MREGGVADVGVGCIEEEREEILLACGGVPKCCY